VILIELLITAIVWYYMYMKKMNCLAETEK